MFVCLRVSPVAQASLDSIRLRIAELLIFCLHFPSAGVVDMLPRASVYVHALVFRVCGGQEPICVCARVCMRACACVYACSPIPGCV